MPLVESLAQLQVLAQLVALEPFGPSLFLPSTPLTGLSLPAVALQQPLLQKMYLLLGPDGPILGLYLGLFLSLFPLQGVEYLMNPQ